MRVIAKTLLLSFLLPTSGSPSESSGNLCTDFQPLPREQVTTLEVAKQHRVYYATCKRNVPAWLYQLIKRLEKEQTDE